MGGKNSNENVRSCFLKMSVIFIVRVLLIRKLQLRDMSIVHFNLMLRMNMRLKVRYNDYFREINSLCILNIVQVELRIPVLTTHNELPQVLQSIIWGDEIDFFHQPVRKLNPGFNSSKILDLYFIMIFPDE